MVAAGLVVARMALSARPGRGFLPESTPSGTRQDSVAGAVRGHAWDESTGAAPCPTIAPNATPGGGWHDSATMADDVPIELFLDAFPPQIRSIAHELRGHVHASEPDLVERVRGGWALIGYDIPVGRSKRYVGFIAPEREHIHLGFEVGTLMTPRPELEGADLGLRKVRFVTWRPGDTVDAALVRDLVREAVGIARMSTGERALLAESRRSG